MVRSDTLARAGHCTSGHQELRAANTRHSSSASVPRDPPASHCHDTSPVTCHELSRGLPCHDDPLRPAGDRLHHPHPAAHGALTPRLPAQVDIYRPRYPVDIIYTYLHSSGLRTGSLSISSEPPQQQQRLSAAEAEAGYPPPGHPGHPGGLYPRHTDRQAQEAITGGRDHVACPHVIVIIMTSVQAA